MKECNYGMHARFNGSSLIKFIVNSIHIYVFKLVHYKSIFHNESNDIYVVS
jgi:hypothetical protein